MCPIQKEPRPSGSGLPFGKPTRSRSRLLTCNRPLQPALHPAPIPGYSPRMAQWIVTAVGPDRPGIVGDLTGHLHAAEANLLDSRMVNLRGQFALVLLMECPEGAAGEHLATALPEIGRGLGLNLDVIRRSSAE